MYDCHCKFNCTHVNYIKMISCTILLNAISAKTQSLAVHGYDERRKLLSLDAIGADFHKHGFSERDTKTLEIQSKPIWIEVVRLGRIHGIFAT